MRLTPIRAALLAMITLAAPPAFAQVAKQALAEPSISPQQKLIAFVSNSQIWEAPANGGAARVLVGDADSGNEHPLYSPDGTHLAFQKTRGPARGIYVLDLHDGTTRRITWDSGEDVLDNWSADGKWLYFSSGRYNVFATFNGIFRVPAAGGTPMPVLNGMYQDQEMSAPDANGRLLAFSFGGLPGWQWWRNGHAHIDTGAIWQADLSTSTPTFTRLTADDARAEWPMWGRNHTLYYVSDRSGAENIWQRNPDGKETQITRFTSGRVLWPHVSVDGGAIVFERDFGIWKLDLASGSAAAVAVEMRAASQPVADTRYPVNGHISSSASSPDGSKVAVVARGQLLVGATEAPFASVALPLPEGDISDLAWTPDQKALIYIARRNGHYGVYRYDLTRSVEHAISAPGADADQPVVSPDGKSLAYLANERDLTIADLASGARRVMAHTLFGMPKPLSNEHVVAWSPDSRWLAYIDLGDRQFDRVNVVAARGGNPIIVSALGNTEASDVSWSPEGDSIYYVTGQRTEDSHIARVRLVDPPAQFASNALEAQLQGRKDAPVRAAFNGVLPPGDRISYLPISADVTGYTFSPNGKWLVYSAHSGDHDYLYVTPIDSLRSDVVPMQLTTFELKAPNSVWLDPEIADMSVTHDGKAIYFRRHTGIARIPIDLSSDHIDGGTPKREDLALQGKVLVHFEAEKALVLDQVYSALRDTFFDAARAGSKWKATRDTFAPYVAGATDLHTLYRLFDLMIGELDSSHSGAFEPTDPSQVAQGHIGLIFDPTAYQAHGTLRIKEILPNSPAAAGNAIHVGDELISINGKLIQPDQDANAYLADLVDQRCRMLMRHAASGSYSVDIKPITETDEQNLFYREWVARNTAWVRQHSQGAAGYLHLRDMTMPSLLQFYKDIDAANAGSRAVVIDVRNNFGGFVNSYVLDALGRLPYIYMQPRGFDKPSSARAILGQHALERATVLVVNRETLSDGEDFTEGYRTLGLGKVVGEDTAGWIIYTSGANLLDGGKVRLPFVRITGAKGDPMEENPRKVDLPVNPQPVFWYGQTDGYLQQALQTIH